MKKPAFAIAVLAGAGLSVVPPAFGQADDKALVTVHFETTCNPEAQKFFDGGMLCQHSFWHRASQR